MLGRLSGGICACACYLSRIPSVSSKKRSTLPLIATLRDVNHHKLLFLDEPTSGLDSVSATKLSGAPDALSFRRASRSCVCSCGARPLLSSRCSRWHRVPLPHPSMAPCVTPSTRCPTQGGDWSTTARRRRSKVRYDASRQEGVDRSFYPPFAAATKRARLLPLPSRRLRGVPRDP